MAVGKHTAEGGIQTRTTQCPTRPAGDGPSDRLAGKPLADHSWTAVSSRDSELNDLKQGFLNLFYHSLMCSSSKNYNYLFADIFAIISPVQEKSVSF